MSSHTEAVARLQGDKRVNGEGAQLFGTQSGSKTSGRERALAIEWRLLLPTAVGLGPLAIPLF